jgi:hypothetical protein
MPVESEKYTVGDHWQTNVDYKNIFCKQFAYLNSF